MPKHPPVDQDAERVDRSPPFRDRVLTRDDLDRIADGAARSPDEGHVEALRQQLESLARALPGRNPLKHVGRPSPARRELDAVVEARRIIAEARRQLADEPAPPPVLRDRSAPVWPAKARQEPPPAHEAALTREQREYEWERAMKPVFERAAPSRPEERHEPPQPTWRSVVASHVPRDRRR